MNDATLQPISWHTAADFVGAGSIVGIAIEDDLATIQLDVAYANIQERQGVEATFQIVCLNCSYITISRLYHHEPGSGAIYEAYLHDKSSLIEDLFANRLEGKSGALHLQSRFPNRPIKHLEIIGEVNVNVLCEEVRVNQTSDTLLSA